MRREALSVFLTLALSCRASHADDEYWKERASGRFLKSHIGQQVTVKGRWSNCGKFGPYIALDGDEVKEISIEPLGCGNDGYRRSKVVTTKDGKVVGLGERAPTDAQAQAKEAQQLSKINGLYQRYKEGEVVSASGRLCYYTIEIQGPTRRLMVAIPPDHYYFCVDDLKIERITSPVSK